LWLSLACCARDHFPPLPLPGGMPPVPVLGHLTLSAGAPGYAPDCTATATDRLCAAYCI